MPEIIIRHPKSGKEYGIQSSDYRRGKHVAMPDGSTATYEEAGFKIVSLADGSPYEGPLNEPPASHAPAVDVNPYPRRDD